MDVGSVVGVLAGVAVGSGGKEVATVTVAVAMATLASWLPQPAKSQANPKNKMT